MRHGEHTPGPWLVGGDCIYQGVRNEEGLPDALDGPRIAILVHAADGVGEEECQANAKLLAAAPDLVAALEAVRELLFSLADSAADEPIWNDGGAGHEVAKQVRRVLRKAGAE